MNDSPVDCQNRDRLFRRKANPRWIIRKKDRFQKRNLSFFQLYLPLASYIATQLYSAYAEWYYALHRFDANIISLKPKGFNITFD